MIKANPKDAIVRKQIESVEFGFYSDQEVRDRSVAEITSSQAFDPNNNALPGGLYDPRMGPSAKDSDPPCPTCAVTSHNCPGHFGHIELAVTVYHPMLMGDLVTALRLKCLNCHKLRVAARQMAIFRAKFSLLQQHQLADLLDLDDTLAQAVRHAREGTVDLGSGEVDQQVGDSSTSGGNSNSNKAAASKRVAAMALDEALQSFQPSRDDDDATVALRKRQETSYERKLRKLLIQECMTACKGSKNCPHCGAHSNKIRQDSSNKIFQAALSAKMSRMNTSAGIKILSALQTDKEAGYDSDDTDREMDDEENEDDVDSDEEGVPSKTSARDKFMHAGEVQAQMKRLWLTEPYLCNYLFGSGGSWSTEGYSIFFLQAVPVPPSRFRPAMHLNGMAVEHSQTQYLSKMIQLNEQIRNHFAAGNEPRAYTSWIDLQTAVNCFMDSSKDPSASNAAQVAPGIRQLLERKEGLFRKNMMGKRVDYACRSVISPDPYVGTNEIGLPQYFARVLTYPTPVTDLNVKEMRQLVERGPHNYPGARWVEISGKRVDLSKMKRWKREGVAAQLLTHLKKGGMPALVGRQLRDGDYVLMNRQPTLHKPGIMAHRVRILHNPQQKTIRMHYANCNTYNADFDGDEMNCHFPQSDLARAEAQYIAKTDLQYIVPTDGSPLRGLIQDHVVGGVKLTKRDTFLEKWEYQQLLFSALASLPGLEVIQSDMDIEMVPPAVLKPRELWTGKQVITTLLLHLRKGRSKDSPDKGELPGLSTSRKSKTPETAFGSKQEEHLVLVRDGELLRGVLDKAAFGATDFSLVHAVYEAYGPEKAGLFLNSLGRLFTAYIQFYSGHSCRMEDLILTKEADEARRKLVQRAYSIGSRAAKAWADSEGGKVPIPSVKEQEGSEMPLKPVETASASAKIGHLLSGNEGATNFAALDGYMQGQLNPLASEIVKTCLPSGLAVPFPYNTFSVMTTTGAKGSIVNQSQVTCALGQQALEGRRVPRLSSGRTLPSFAPYDPNPRADGFVMDRFLTGIRPQEYYFHCMAGREGLVDTAVKTSRSGYLQRCLMKHLEELKLCYDYTVRNAEGGVVQFLYGEDGLDPIKASYLDCTVKSFEYMARNHVAIARQNVALPSSTLEVAAADVKRREYLESDDDRPFAKGDLVKARKLRTGNVWKRGALCRGWHEATVTKTHSKGKKVDLKYVTDGQTVKDVPILVNLGRCGGRDTPAVYSTAVIVKAAVADPILSSPARGHRVGSSGSCVSERLAKAALDAMNDGELKGAMSRSRLSKSELGSLIAAKYSSSLCTPGEAVGSIAAQSIGEPSTQMTLNTFHLAGAGANVTLGIPRLREIIMTASQNLKTPTMSVPLHESVTEKKAVRMTRDFTKLTLMELISGDKGISVTERLERGDAGNWERAYYVVMKLHPAERISEAFGLSLVDAARVVSKNFVPLLTKMMKDELKRSTVDGTDVSDVLGGGSADHVDIIEADENAESSVPTTGFADELDDADNEGDEDDAPGEEDGVEAARHRRRTESVSYDDDGDEDISDEQPVQGPSDEMEEDNDIIDGAANTAFSERKTTPTVNKKDNTIYLQPLLVDPASRPLLMVGLVEKAAARTLVRSRAKIDQAFINDEDGGRGRCLQTAGVNFSEMWELDNVDHNCLMSNDIWAIRCAYGVEAARSSIGTQVRSVFGAYGIEVDPRHLSLISDYMTQEGGFKAMNRIGIEGSSSTLLQMSFETTVHFMRQAAIANTRDTLESPSASIVMGRPIRHGTGAFALLTNS